MLSITVPSSAALPSVPPGGTTSAQLGTVTVNDFRGTAAASWTATVTATTFVTGGGTAAETIPLTQITYWSGPATASTGTGTFTPGQANAAAAVNLTVPRTAFSLTAGSSVNSASWNPTLSVSVPAAGRGGHLHRHHHPLRGLTPVTDHGAIRAGADGRRAGQSRKSRRSLDRDGWRSLYMALDSIWRIRSRVTPYTWLIWSRVLG